MSIFSLPLLLLFSVNLLSAELLHDLADSALSY